MHLLFFNYNCLVFQDRAENLRIIIIIVYIESPVQGRERVRTLLIQRPQPTQVTHGMKKYIK